MGENGSMKPLLHLLRTYPLLRVFVLALGAYAALSLALLFQTVAFAWPSLAFSLAAIVVLVKDFLAQRKAKAAEQEDGPE